MEPSNSTSSSSKIIYQGAGIPPPSIEQKTDLLAKKFVEALLHGSAFPRELCKKTILKTIFLKQDAYWLKCFQDQLQIELEHLATLLPQNESEAIVWNGFLGNILAILPFTYPLNESLIKIPYLQDGRCELVEYKIEVLYLQGHFALTPMTALGLTPFSHDTARSIITFIGTTYPAGSGFLASVLTDFHPHNSVGEHTFKSAKPVLDKWFQDKENVHVVGTSLGGALAFHTLQNYHQKLEQLNIYNAPGLKAKKWKRDFNEGCSINIYQQPIDLVPQVGIFPKGKKVNLYKVSRLNNSSSYNIFSAHIRAYCGCEHIEITKEDPATENQNRTRKFVSLLHSTLGPLLIYYPCMFFYTLYKLSLLIKSHFPRHLI